MGPRPRGAAHELIENRQSQIANIKVHPAMFMKTKEGIF
jgi:hypothetical protein